MTRDSRKGWGRLGVVLSAVWLVVALAYAAFDYHRINSKEGGWETAGRSADHSAEMSPKSLLTECGYENDQIYSSCSPRYRNITILVFGPIAVAWLLVIALVYAALWVRAGFRDDGS